MKVLLLGAGGMLARAVQSTAPAHIALRALTRAELDVTDEAAVRAALARGTACVINCAAWTRVDAAEDHEREATLVNGDAVGCIARAARDEGARVLHISTEYVFDGTLDRPYREDDAPQPQGAYGRSKLAGERALTAAGGRWTLIRTQWLYGGGPSFVRTMWNRARQGLASRVVNDQWGAPTHVAELAAVIWRFAGADAVAGGEPFAGGELFAGVEPFAGAEPFTGAEPLAGTDGIWHAAASGWTNWYEVARTVYALTGADPALVTPCSAAEFGARAPRPANGRLDTTKLDAMRPWDEVLRESLTAAQGGADGP